MFNFVFGPIASRRLGISLGVDLVRAKTCNLDCLYCEARRTTLLTTQRREYVPVAQVITELREYLERRPELDCITFSGAGEPTLNSGIGKVIAFLKAEYPQYRVCVLTNGCLLGDPQVARELAPADLVIPSLDASCTEEFQRLNRPAPGVEFSACIAGLAAFIRQYPEKVALEIFVAPGINDSAAALERFCSLIRQLQVGCVQLNTLDRPGTDPRLRPAPPETLAHFAEALAPYTRVEVVGQTRSGKARTALHYPEIEAAIGSVLQRRPLAFAGLHTLLGLNADTLREHLNRLLAAGKISVETVDQQEFYRLNAPHQETSPSQENL